MTPPKTAIVSHVLPPSPSGQAVVLYRLLEGMPPDRYCLISRERYEGDARGDGVGSPREVDAARSGEEADLLVEAPGQEIDGFALSFVPPLRTHNDHVGHEKGLNL